MTTEEIERLLLDALRVVELLDHVREQQVSPWVYPAFVLTAHTGARRSEMMRAKPEDVDLAGKGFDNPRAQAHQGADDDVGCR